MASVIETIYNKFQAGDALTDADLDAGIEHFNNMSDMLWKSGPVFRLCAQEAIRVADRLQGFRNARREKK